LYITNIVEYTNIKLFSKFRRVLARPRQYKNAGGGELVHETRTKAWGRQKFILVRERRTKE